MTPVAGPLCGDWMRNGPSQVWDGCTHNSCWAIVSGLVPPERGLLPAWERLKDMAFGRSGTARRKGQRS